MLARNAYQALLDWKRHDERKALLVEGARQIGKTFLVEEFARREYSDYIKIDFLENDDAAKMLAGASSVQQVMSALSLISGKPAVPGETLVFFDEVQKAQNVLTFSKYLVQDGRFDVVMSGSLLGVELSHVKSLPVGYMRVETMYPLTFAEFCQAQGVPAEVMASLRQKYDEMQPVDDAVHERMVQLFRLYLVVGGMPEAVQLHIASKGDLGAVRQVQNDLVKLYGEDIAKHAKDRVLQVKSIYEALPSQLDKENKRFQLKSLQSDAKFSRFANDFAWLVGADAALKVTNVTDPRPMLERSEEEGRFKLYQSDVGMLMSQYHSNVALGALSGARSVNFGGVYENAVAQELAAAGVPLHYFHNNRIGEVDFIVETDKGTVLPVEVKSGKGYKRHVALNKLLKSEEYDIGKACVLSESNVSVEARGNGVVNYFPLYMTPFVAEDAKGAGLAGVVAPAPTW